MMHETVRWLGTRSAYAVGAVAAIAVLAAVGCSGGRNALKEKALGTYKTTMQENKSFEVYGLQTAARSSAPETLQILIDGAAERGYDISYQALLGLVDRPEPGAIDALRAAYQEKRGALKQIAALALAKTGDEDAKSWLAAQLDDPAANPSPEILVFLAKAGEDEPVRKLLSNRIAGENEDLRDMAYAVLGEICTPWAKQMLLQGLEREHGARRKEAIAGIGKCADPEMVDKVVPFTNTQGLVFATIEALGQMGGEKALQTLTSLKLDEPLAEVYIGAALWKLGDKEGALAKLQPLLDSEDVTVRVNLAEQLAPLTDPEVHGMLEKLATDSDKNVRVTAIRALREHGGPELQAFFVERAKDADYEVSTIATEALGAFADASVLETLRPMLENDNPYVKIAAANAILEIADRTSPKAKG